MEITSIVLARAIYIFELGSLDPFGRMSASESILTLRERYGFVSSPKTPGDVNLEKGAEFSSGRMGDIVIDKLTLFPNGIMVDTRSSTDESEKVASDILEKARQDLASTVRISRKHYVSQLTFRSEMHLASLNPVLKSIAERVSKSLSDDLLQPILMEPTSIKIFTDLTQVRVTPGYFSIERRDDTPFFDNVYFASAPLRTGVHVELVEEFEKALL
jgi:hypothetical protein